MSASTKAGGTRTETDSRGTAQVPAQAYWGAQTQRALIHFALGRDRIAPEPIHALGLVKQAAAQSTRSWDA